MLSLISTLSDLEHQPRPKLSEAIRLKLGISKACYYERDHEHCYGRAEGTWYSCMPYLNSKGEVRTKRLQKCGCPCHEGWIRQVREDSDYAYLWIEELVKKEGF